MPRGDLTDEFTSSSSVPPYDRLKFSDKKEKARITIPDMGLLWIEWVHTMRAPVLDEGGNPIETTLSAGKGGKTRTGFATDFVGAFKCLGRQDVMRRDHLDPDRCPGCAASARGVRDMEPERRFAIPVIRYDTKDKFTTALRNPPGATILIWTLTQKMYDKLMDQRPAIRELLELADDAEVKFRQVDLTIECEDPQFQRTVFGNVLRPAVKHDVVKAVVGPLWGDVSNRPTDDQLLHAVVKPKELKWVTRDIEDHEERWAAADRAKNGGPAAKQAANGAGAVSGDADSGLDSLLNNLDDVTPPPAAPSDGDPFGEDSAKVAAAPAPATAASDDPFSDDSAPAAPAAAATAADDPFGDDSAPAAANPGGMDEFAPKPEPAASSPAAGQGADDDPFGDPAPAAPAAAAPVNGKAGGSFDDIMKEALS